MNYTHITRPYRDGSWRESTPGSGSQPGDIVRYLNRDAIAKVNHVNGDELDLELKLEGASCGATVREHTDAVEVIVPGPRRPPVTP